MWEKEIGVFPVSLPDQSDEWAFHTRNAWISRRPPAWEMISDPSTDTVILAHWAVIFSWKVPFDLARQDSRRAQFFQLKGTFYV
jgi:hypothetical protein